MWRKRESKRSRAENPLSPGRWRTVGLVLAATGLSATFGVARADAYYLNGCKWGTTSIKFYVPSPLVSYTSWWNGANSWSGLQAQYVAGTSSSHHVYGNNENRGNTVIWTGATRTKGTVQSPPSCTGGFFSAGQVEVVINWSLVTTYGYSSSQIRMVAAHELGHAFGLAHNPDSLARLMYPYDSRTVITPQTDDKAGVNAIY